MIPLVLFSLFVLCLVLMPYIIHAFVTSKKYSRYIAFFMISMAIKPLYRKFYCLTFLFVLIAFNIVFYFAFPYDKSVIYSTALIIIFAFPKLTDKIFNWINTDWLIRPKFMGVLILTFLMFAAYFLSAESLCLVISLYIILLASYYYPSTKTIMEMYERLHLFLASEIAILVTSEFSIADFIELRKQDETRCSNYISSFLNKLYLNENMSYFSTLFLPFWDPDYALFKCSKNLLYNIPIFESYFLLYLKEFLSKDWSKT